MECDLWCLVAQVDPPPMLPGGGDRWAIYGACILSFFTFLQVLVNRRAERLERKEKAEIEAAAIKAKAELEAAAAKSRAELEDRKFLHDQRNKEQRRQWELEDRAYKRKIRQQQRALSKKTDELMTKVEETKQDAKTAYKEANDVNKKLEKIGVKLVEETTAQEHIKATVEDTNQVVHEIKDQAGPEKPE